MNKKGNIKEEQEVFSFNLKTTEKLLKKELENTIASARNVIAEELDPTGKIGKEVELKIHTKWDAKFLVMQTFFIQKMIEARTRIVRAHKKEQEINRVLQELDFSYEIAQLVRSLVLEYELDFRQENYIKKELMKIQQQLIQKLKPCVEKAFASVSAYIIEKQKKELKPISLLAKMTLLLAYYKLKFLLELNQERLEVEIELLKKNILDQCKTNLLKKEYNQIEKVIEANYTPSFITKYKKKKQMVLQQFCEITGTIYINQYKEFIILESAYLKIKTTQSEIDVEGLAKHILSFLALSTRKKEEDVLVVLLRSVEEGQYKLLESEKCILDFVLEAIEDAKKEVEFILKDKMEEEITISYLKEIVKKELFRFKEIPMERYRI